MSHKTFRLKDTHHRSSAQGVEGSTHEHSLLKCMLKAESVDLKTQDIAQQVSVSKTPNTLASTVVTYRNSFHKNFDTRGTSCVDVATQRNPWVSLSATEEAIQRVLHIQSTFLNT